MFQRWFERPPKNETARSQGDSGFDFRALNPDMVDVTWSRKMGVEDFAISSVSQISTGWLRFLLEGFESAHEKQQVSHDADGIYQSPAHLYFSPKGQY